MNPALRELKMKEALRDFVERLPVVETESDPEPCITDENTDIITITCERKVNDSSQSREAMRRLVMDLTPLFFSIWQESILKSKSFKDFSKLAGV